MSKLAKSFNYLLAVLFVLSIFLVKTPIVHATCPLTIDPNQVADAGAQPNITLTSNGCFTGTPGKPQNYVVIAYPEELSLEKAIDARAFAIHRSNYPGSGFTGAPAAYVENTDSNSLSTTLDFGYERYGSNIPAIPSLKKLLKDKYNNRPYKVRACVIDLGRSFFDPVYHEASIRKRLKNCTGNALVGETQPGSLWVGENPSGTVPDDLPIIDKKSQTTCVFQITKPIIINKINNIVKKNGDNGDYEDYGWWLYGEQGDQTPLNRRTDPKTNEFIISEPPSDPLSAQARIIDEKGLKEVKPGIRRICVDIKSESTERAANVQFQNCLFIEIVASLVETDPAKKMSCDEIQTESVNCSKYPDRCSSAGGPVVPGCNDAKVTDPTDLNKTIPNPNPGIPTAIGCIHTNPVALVKDFLKFALGISGGLAFLLMLLGAFQMLTSAGNPETLAAGKSRLTSAIIGLLFVIFSVLLLKIIGVDILGLGGQFGY